MASADRPGPGPDRSPIPSLTCVSVLSPVESAPPPSDGSAPPPLPPASVDSPAWQCSWSKDGGLLASCHGAPDACVRVWRRDAGAADGGEDDRTCSGGRQIRWSLVATLRGGHSRTVRSVSFAPCGSGHVLASASFDGTVAIWERFEDGMALAMEEGASTARGGETAGGWECTAQLEGHESEVKCVCWNGTGSLLATCGRDKSVWIWETFLPGTIGGCGDRDPDGGGGGDDGEVECLAVLHGHTGDVKAIEFAPSHGQWGDGDEILLSASYDDTVRCWAEDGGDWYCAATLSAHTSTVWTVAASSGGSRLVTGSADRSLAIWRCYTARERRGMEPDSTGSDGLWKCVGRLPSAHDGPVYSVHCSPPRAGHGRMASAGADDRIRVYREETSGGGTSDSPMFAVDAEARAAHDGDVNCVRWHPRDGSMLASAGDDGLVRVWRYDAS